MHGGVFYWHAAAAAAAAAAALAAGDDDDHAAAVAARVFVLTAFVQVQHHGRNRQLVCKGQQGMMLQALQR